MKNSLATNRVYWRNYTVGKRNNVVVRQIHREANQLADKLANLTLIYEESITCSSNQQRLRGYGAIHKLDRI